VAEELWEADENRDADTDPKDSNRPRILIVARGAQERELVRKELTSALAPDSSFAEAGNVWEVLQQAPRCGVVMLAGALPDVSLRTLSELLGRRHPWLPIVVLDPPDGEAWTGPVSY
jgi:DNA-binding NtrC family response regulator